MSIRNFLHYQPHIEAHAFVDESAVVTGQVWLGEDASVWPCVSIRGDLLPIRIGKRSNIQDGSCLHTTHAGPYHAEGFSLLIGDEVTVGHNVTLHGCTLEDQCLVGMGSIVLDGAVVSSHVVIGAGSIVPPGKKLESGYLYLGSPVKKIRPLTEKEIAFFHYSAQHYVMLKNKHLNEST